MTDDTEAVKLLRRLVDGWPDIQNCRDVHQDAAAFLARLADDADIKEIRFWVDVGVGESAKPDSAAKAYAALDRIVARLKERS